MRIIKAYKTVTVDLKSGHGNVSWVIGEWKKHEGDLKLCECGFHASKHPYDAALVFNQGSRLFEVEARGTIVNSDNKDKFVSSEMRLVKEIVTDAEFRKVCVRFGVWNAKQVLPIFEKNSPGDNRVRNLIEVLDKWLIGAANLEEVRNARYAASAAYASAAASAASAAYAAYATAYATASAADAAAYAAANAADAASAAASAASAASAAYADRKNHKQNARKKFKESCLSRKHI